MDMMPSFRARQSTAPMPFARRVVPLLALACSGQAAAAVILVGDSADPACSVHTIQEAIDLARAKGGVNTILVAAREDGGAYRENLRFTGLPEGSQLEVVGSVQSCSNPEPGETRTIVDGSGSGGGAVAFIDGGVDLEMRGLHLAGGSTGLMWQGHGRVALTDVAVESNLGAGIFAIGLGGEARIELLGDVRVSGNFSEGVYAWDSMLVIRGDGNRISHNQGSGVVVDRMARADIGATGAVIHANGMYGLHVLHSGETVVAPTLLYSTDPANPLTISANQQGAIFQAATGSSHEVCARNVAFMNNSGNLVHVEGSLAKFEFNGSGCEFPPAAHVACTSSSQPGECSTIAYSAAPGRSLISATGGAHIDIGRVLIVGNSAATLVSSGNLAEPSGSVVRLDTAVVTGNLATDALFLADEGGVLDVVDSTVFGNFGSFPASFAGTRPDVLQAIGSIVDQPQDLLHLAGDPAAAQMHYVLARNRIGAEGDMHEVVIGQPSYSDSLGRLASGSPGTDQAPAAGGVDYDGNPRDVDLEEMPDGAGPRDIGAFETPAPPDDRIFGDGFDPVLD